MRRLLWLASLSLPWSLAAGTADRALEFDSGSEAKLQAEAAYLAGSLRSGGAVYFKLPAEALPSRDAKGRWRREPLQAALADQEPLIVRGGSQSSDGVKLVDPPGRDEGRWLLASGLPKVLLLENSSTVAPLSKGLKAWAWPHQSVGFAEVEADPGKHLNAEAYDLVVFSSPGWWQDFANPPGGPSRMPAKVLDALRTYVRQGGSALFVDIAQWDLEKAWPKSLGLAPLGPYAVSKLELAGQSGGLSLAPVGLASDRLQADAAFSLGGSESFEFPDGTPRALHAAYAMPDPGGGQGWVAGLAFHVFEQDDSLGGAARRLLLNLLMLSGNRRLATQGEPKAPTPEAASPTVTRERTATPSPTEAPPTATAQPSATPLPPTATPLPTEPPTPLPTSIPTALPTPRPTPVPATLVPTRIPSPLPTLAPPVLPTLRPTVLPATVLPTRMPTALPSPMPTQAPTQRPTQVPTRVPTLAPTPIPTRPRPTPVPTRPRPTLVPTRVWATAVPTWTWPTPLPTLARPTAVPTLTRPTAVPTLAWPAPPPLPTLVRARATLRPTLRPTAAPTLRPKAPPPSLSLVPTPRPTAQLTSSVGNALGCLDSAPEPFGDGGVYVKFCLRRAAKVRVEVFDLKGRSLWRSKPERLVAGTYQRHFEGWVKGARLPAGGYLYQVEADYGRDQLESRQGRMNREKSRKR